MKISYDEETKFHNLLEFGVGQEHANFSKDDLPILFFPMVPPSDSFGQKFNKFSTWKMWLLVIERIFKWKIAKNLNFSSTNH